MLSRQWDFALLAAQTPDVPIFCPPMTSLLVEMKIASNKAVPGTASLDDLQKKLYSDLPMFLPRQGILHERLFCRFAF